MAKPLQAILEVARPSLKGERGSGAELGVRKESHTIYDGCLLSVQVTESKEQNYDVLFNISARGMTLHWAVNDWQLPEASMWPEGSWQAGTAVQTPFHEAHNGSYEVTIKISGDVAPAQLVFVLKDEQEKWFNNGGNFTTLLRPPRMSDIVSKVINAEVTYEHWSLLNRFALAADSLNAAELAGPSGMAFIYTWLRFSSTRQLAWYRNNNYQSKDIAFVQKRLANEMAAKARGANDPAVRRFARMALSTLPRGGGDAEEIRMGILHIMRDNGIREGHRPGLEEKFLEQWHQKLHTNTSAEDIIICEAYLEFLHTNSLEAYRKALLEKGGITEESLATMDHPITEDPLHLPHLIPAFQHFLWVLKTVHSGADLDVTVEMSKRYLDEGLNHMLRDILANRGAWWVPGRVVEARVALAEFWRRDAAPRDVVLLDIALDNYFGLCISGIDKSTLEKDDLCELISLVLQNAVLAEESTELRACLAYWIKVKSEPRWSADWAQLAMAAVETITLTLQAHMDEVARFVQPHAEHLGKACSIPESYILNFGEEAVRGKPLFNLSGLLLKLAPLLRSAAGLGPWQVVSQVAARGNVLVIPSLADIQGQSFDSPQVVIADQVGGMEDIPEGVTAVLSGSVTDVLSHVAIRARNANVLLASCFDPEVLVQLKSFQGKDVEAAVDGSGDLRFAEAEGTTKSEPAVASNGADQANGITLDPIVVSHEWILDESSFREGVVGGKSANIASLRRQLSPTISLPPSMTLPFGTFERVLADPINATAAGEVKSLMRSVASWSSPGVPAELQELREIVSSQIRPVDTLRTALTEMAHKTKLVSKDHWGDDATWQQAWHAISQVWASKWTDRAWLSRRSRGVPEEALHMACLLQRVVPAQYAFVLHTAHPVSKDPSTMLAEVVVGLGEVLVGNHPGRAFSFSAAKDGASAPRVLSLPSKRVAMFSVDPNMIARSDSNGEDLEAFAGAGLYDSVLLESAHEQHVDYSREPLIWNPQFRAELMEGIVKVGMEVEAAYGGRPQDIEGVYIDGKFTVVQARPQIL